MQREAADRRRALLADYSLSQLAQFIAQNSHPLTGDRHIVSYCLAEMSERHPVPDPTTQLESAEVPDVS